MAYEGKKLVEKLKAKGIMVEVEDGAQKVVDAVSEWLTESAIESETKVDDVLVPLALAGATPIINAQVDKIDGVVG